MGHGCTDKETHYKYIKSERDFIVNGWIKYFGRLPLPATSFDAVVSDEVESEEEEQDIATTNPLSRLSESKSPQTKYATNGFDKFAGASRSDTGIAGCDKDISIKTDPADDSPPRAAATLSVLRRDVKLSKKTPQEQRLALGIVDNEENDWDADSS